jgi:hypothetical protein
MKNKSRPFHLKRHPTLQEVSIELLKVDGNREHDAHFIKLYQNYLTGSLKGAWTRVEATSIVAGLIKHDHGKLKEIIEYDQDKAAAHIMAAEIRRGLRPAITLYPGFLPIHSDKFICVDDMATFYAYRQLGISKIPALILGSPKLSNESAILSSYTPDGSAKNLHLVSKDLEYALISLGADISDLPFTTAISQLISHVDGCLAAISAFDLPAEPDQKIQYHETLYSIAYRMKEGLIAMRLLDENGLLLQGRSVVRTMYELSLNFYLDWLAPHIVGPLLQSLSDIGRLPKSEDKKKLEQLLRKRFGGLVDLCETVAAKGRMSPVGEVGHERIYGRLSPVAHQDFSVTQQYVHSLSEGKRPESPREEVEFLIRVLDIAVCNTVSRILDDVGAGNMI